MSMPPTSSSAKVSAEELSSLAALMRKLTDHAAQLEIAHHALQRQVAALDVELEHKNQALERKNRELDRITSQLTRVLDSISEGVVTIDERGRIQRANRAAAAILGRTSSSLEGISLRELLPRETHDRLAPALREGGHVEGMEAYLFDASPNQTPIPVQLSLAPLPREHDGPDAPRLMLQFADLREVQALEERARRSDRLRALGELAAGVAHEVRNPLTTVRGYVQLLPEECGDPAFVNEMTNQVLGEIDRLAKLTDSLLHLARPTASALSRVDLIEWLRELVAFEHGRLSQQGVRLACEPCANGPVTACMDEERMRQVLLNLINNGAEAMPQGGDLTLRARQEGESHRRWAVVTVEDTGGGIPGDQLETIFNPFYTTKPNGSGLGLAISHRIVEEHLGHIRVTSNMGRGTIMDVWLPVVGAAEPGDQEAHA